MTRRQGVADQLEQTLTAIFFRATSFQTPIISTRLSVRK